MFFFIVLIVLDVMCLLVTLQALSNICALNRTIKNSKPSNSLQTTDSVFYTLGTFYILRKALRSQHWPFWSILGFKLLGRTLALSSMNISFSC